MPVNEKCCFINRSGTCHWNNVFGVIFVNTPPPRSVWCSHAPAAECMSHIPGTWQHQLNIACQPNSMLGSGFLPVNAESPSRYASLLLLSCTGELDLSARGRHVHYSLSGLHHHCDVKNQMRFCVLCPLSERHSSIHTLIGFK